MKFVAKLKESVGAKIALTTILSLSATTIVFVSFFIALNIRLLSSITFVQAILIFAFSQVIVGVLSVMLATNHFIKRPLEKLSDVMGMAQTGHHLARVSLNSIDEIGDLANSLNEMLVRLSELDTHKISSERELVKIREGLKYKEELESKARVIKVTNLKLEQSLKNLSILYVVSQTLSQILDADELYNAIREVLLHTLKMNHFSVILKKEEDLYTLVAADGISQYTSKISFRPGEGIVGKVILDQMATYIPDLSLESRSLYDMHEMSQVGSYLIIPLKLGDRLLGVLTVGRREVNGFGEADRKLCDSVANQLAMSIDRSNLYMQTKMLSVKDELTGVSNRRHFQELLHMEFKRAERFDRPLSLLMIDVDYFKEFNDRYGHIRGDQALKRLAKILRENVREVDTVARFGGEEFIIILADTDLQDARIVALKLRHLVEEDFLKLWDNKQSSRSLTISVGVANYPETNRSEENLINAADLALYKAKETGRNQVVLFDKNDLKNDELPDDAIIPDDKFLK